MTPRFFTSSIFVNIFKIPTNLFQTLILFLRKTSVITMATLGGNLATLTIPEREKTLKGWDLLKGKVVSSSAM